MPETITVDGEAITLDDSWTYTATYYTNINKKPDGSNNYVKYGNTITMHSETTGLTETSTAWKNLGQPGTLWKSYERDGLSIKWTETAFIPSGSADSTTQLRLEDRLYIVSQSNGLVNDAEFSVTITWVDSDGVEHTEAPELVTYDEATKTISTPSGDTTFIYFIYQNPYANSDGTYTNNVIIYLGTKTDNTGPIKGHVGSTEISWPVGYTPYWTWETDVQVTITYTTSAEDYLKYIAEYGTIYDNLNNLFILGQYNETNKSWDWNSQVLESVPLTLLSKKCTDEPDSENNYTSSYEVVVNPNNIDLSEAVESELVLYDYMSATMAYVPDTLQITATDADGGEVDVDYTVAFAYGESYNSLTITIADPGPYQYNVTYQTYLLDPQVDVEYWNVMYCELYGVTISSNITSTKAGSISGGGTSYSVIVKKTDQNGDLMLSGAEFTLYEAGTDGITEVTCAETDETGYAVFRTSAGLTFKTHTLYYLVEAAAPAGYNKENTAWYFWFCNSDAETCSECQYLAGISGESVKIDGVTYMLKPVGEQDGLIPSYGTVLTVTNTAGPILPNTGGAGTNLYTIGGALLIAAAVGNGCRLRRRRERRPGN